MLQVSPVVLVAMYVDGKEPVPAPGSGGGLAKKNNTFPFTF